MIDYIIGSDLKSNGKCRMTTGSKPIALTISFMFGIAHGNPFTGEIAQM